MTVLLDTIDWSNPSTYAETGVHHGYATAKMILPPGDWGLEPNPEPVEKAWWAKLDPGGFIVPHIDAGPWVERWHYPESGAGRVRQSGWPGRVGPWTVTAPSIPYRMNHHLPHAVWNDGDEPRIILIVEYDFPVDQPTTDLILCDMIPEVQALIDAVEQ